jgi:FKBP-type peptidyl-prolyl cis-trans isomerase SlyD
MKKIFSVFICILFSHALAFAQSDAKIEKGKKVKMDYTLKVEGQTVETTVGKQPLEYTQGQGMLIPGLERELEGMKVGDQKTVKVEPKDAYGEVNKDAIREFPKTAFPADFKLEIGTVIEIKDEKSQEAAPGVIWDIKDDKVTVNFNHPLAGKTLEFDVKVLDIK